MREDVIGKLDLVDRTRHRFQALLEGNGYVRSQGRVDDRFAKVAELNNYAFVICEPIAKIGSLSQFVKTIWEGIRHADIISREAVSRGEINRWQAQAVTSTRLVVGAIIVDSLVTPTKVLAARRTGPPELAGLWEFPGGKVENGETPEAALRREIREELRVTVRVGLELTSPGGNAWPISRGLEMRLFYASLTSGLPVVGDSHDAIRWLNRNTLYSVDWLVSDRKALPEIFGADPEM